METRFSLHSKLVIEGMLRYNRSVQSQLYIKEGEYKGWRVCGPYYKKRDNSEYYTLKNSRQRKTIMANEMNWDNVEDRSKELEPKPFLDWVR